MTENRSHPLERAPAESLGKSLDGLLVRSHRVNAIELSIELSAEAWRRLFSSTKAQCRHTSRLWLPESHVSQ
jgi:hypothetical protein